MVCKVLFLVRKQFYGSIVGSIATVLLFAKLHPTAVLELLSIFPLSTVWVIFYSHVIKFLMIKNLIINCCCARAWQFLNFEFSLLQLRWNYHWKPEFWKLYSHLKWTVSTHCCYLDLLGCWLLLSARDLHLYRSHCSFFRRVLSRILLFFLIILCIEFLICNALLNPPSIRHYKLIYAVIYAKSKPRHTLCIKHKNKLQTYSLHNKFILLKVFFQKFNFSLFLVCPALFHDFWVRSLFEFLFALLFFKVLLTRQFYGFSFLCCSIQAGMPLF